MALKPCYECHTEVSDRAESCPKCGAPMNWNSARTVGLKKSRGTAIALALLFGGIGAHKFYLDQPVWGVVYLLFCWTFIPMMLGILEAIVYLFNSEETFQKTYCKA